MARKIPGAVLLFAILVVTTPLTTAQTTANSTFYSFNDRGGVSIQTTGGTGAVRVGYARVQPGGGTTAPAAEAIFGLRSAGVLVTEAGVPAAPPIVAGRTYAEVNGRINTGIAFANPSGFSITISFYFTDQGGNPRGSGSFNLTAGMQIAKFLNETPFNSP